MRFFFDVVRRGETLADVTGTELSGPDTAILHAAVIAVDLAQDRTPRPETLVRVRNEQGRVLCTLPVLAEE